MLFIIFQITMQNFKQFGVIEKKCQFWVFAYLNLLVKLIIFTIVFLFRMQAWLSLFPLSPSEYFLGNSGSFFLLHLPWF